MPVEAQKFRHIGYQTVIYELTVHSHPLQTLEKESKDHKLKNFGCTSIFQKVPCPKQMLPLWQHPACIPDSTSSAPSKASSTDARLFIPTPLPKQSSAETLLHYLAPMITRQSSNRGQIFFFCTIVLDAPPYVISVNFSSVQQPVIQSAVINCPGEQNLLGTVWQAQPMIKKSKSVKGTIRNTKYMVGYLMTLITFPKSLSVLCSHGHPQISLLMSIKPQPHTHKSRELKNTQKVQEDLKKYHRQTKQHITGRKLFIKSFKAKYCLGKTLGFLQCLGKEL